MTIVFEIIPDLSYIVSTMMREEKYSQEEEIIISETPGLKEVLKNIDAAKKMVKNNSSVKVAVVVTGSEVDQKNYQKSMERTSRHIFNADGSTLVYSFQERIGSKKREGNFLGTLLAFSYLRTILRRQKIRYRDNVTLVGMVFGRGERMSPITQVEGDRKPAISVTAANMDIGGKKVATSAIEEALMYFAPCAKYLEDRGFRGVLDKWGDETEIASIDLTKKPRDNKELEDHDVIKFISVIKITEELAKQKDWVIFDESGNMLAQLSRNDKETLISQMKELGIKPREDGEFYAGVSLGPSAISYKVLTIAGEVFAEEIIKKGVYIDFDPYFLMALAIRGDQKKWNALMEGDPKLREFAGDEGMVPKFFRKINEMRSMFKETYHRELNLKIMDLGKDLYWADIGQHKAMREKYLTLNDKGPNGIIARKIEGIKGPRDSNGNIIVNSEVSPEVKVSDSVIINSTITGSGTIAGSVIKDCIFGDIDARDAFAVLSRHAGSVALKEKGGIYKSYDTRAKELIVEEGERHCTLLTGKGHVSMRVTEDTDLREEVEISEEEYNNLVSGNDPDVKYIKEKEAGGEKKYVYKKNYDRPILGNSISFARAYDEMFGISEEELEKRREKVFRETGEKEMNVGKNIKFKPLKFGTSGLRGLAEEMTDMECYINTAGFIEYLFEIGDITRGDTISIAGDLRPSTPRIARAVSKAIIDAGCVVDYCGEIPSPAISYYGSITARASIMVTGSHIPVERNGIKFNKSTGEVLKSDEEGILKNVARVREAIYSISSEDAIFDSEGALKEEEALSPVNDEAREVYIKRYTSVFPEDCLQDKKIVLYQHSAVGRDIVKEVFEALGAEVITEKRTDYFVPVDTEKVSEDTKDLLKGFAEADSPFAIISTDGDSDRPLLADENGNFLPGDKLGALVSLYLNPTFAAVPVSANDAVITTLRSEDIKVKQTKIGSPYVIAAMKEELASGENSKVVGWESNGGYLVGSDWSLPGGTLKALPTRDAMLPLITVILSAIEKEETLSNYISKNLPSRYTAAGVVDDKAEGCADYTADMGKEIISMFSPGDENITEVEFIPGGVKVTFLSGKEKNVMEGHELSDECCRIKNAIARYFNSSRGFTEIKSINVIDGIRITFKNEEISHIRPSGNAPEFRNYAVADTQERADEIANKRYEIVPAIIRDLRGPVEKPEDRSRKTEEKEMAEDLFDGEKKNPEPRLEPTPKPKEWLEPEPEITPEPEQAHEHIPVEEPAPSGDILAKPIMIKPYEQKKVWGVGGIGEYWYGAEPGATSSIVMPGGIPFDSIMQDENTRNSMIGWDVVRKYGPKLPLVKILTPKKSLSVQFHETKNELWVITGIDENICGDKPMIILGFSQEVIEKFGEKVTDQFKEVLSAYGRALNDIIDILVERGYGDTLAKAGDVTSVAKTVPQVAKELDRLSLTRTSLDRFYSFREVKIGDVIPVSARTLHALGKGIEVVEPQIPGTTQSVDDSDTFPVRYYFPGYERPNAQKELDVDRVGELKTEIAKEGKPVRLSAKLERLPGGFEDKGLEVHRITLQDGEDIAYYEIKSFHSLFTVSGKAKIEIAGKIYNIPNAKPGENGMIIPASSRNYKIIAEEDATQVIDTFSPV